MASTTGANTPSMSHRMCAPVVEYYGVNGIQTRHPHDVTHEIYRSPRSEVPNTNVAAFLVVADSVAPLIGYAPGPGVMDADLDAAGSTPGVATAAQCSLRTHDEHANGDGNTASGSDNTPTQRGVSHGTSWAHVALPGGGAKFGAVSCRRLRLDTRGRVLPRSRKLLDVVPRCCWLHARSAAPPIQTYQPARIRSHDPMHSTRNTAAPCKHSCNQPQLTHAHAYQARTSRVPVPKPNAGAALIVEIVCQQDRYGAGYNASWVSAHPLKHRLSTTRPPTHICHRRVAPRTSNFCVTQPLLGR